MIHRNESCKSRRGGWLTWTGLLGLLALGAFGSQPQAAPPSAPAVAPVPVTAPAPATAPATASRPARPAVTREQALTFARIVVSAREPWAHLALFDATLDGANWNVAVWVPQPPPQPGQAGPAPTVNHRVTVGRTGGSVLYDGRPQTDILPGSEDDEVFLRIEPLAFDRADLSKARFRVTLTNMSPGNMVFDCRLVTGIGVRISTEDPAAESAWNKWISAERTDELPKPAPEDWKERFVKLKPGASLTRDIDLAQPYHSVSQGHATDMEHRHHGFYSENLSKWEIPAKTDRLYVRVSYDRAVWMMAHPQFVAWHGKSVDEIGIWNGRAWSNLLLIAK